jgi:7-cyano-7-deazaguanine synthase in queuosine biosynthesis
MKTLLNLSGGADSIYCAWKWLSENDDKLLIHHCNLKTYQGRAELEQESTLKTLEWLDKNGLTNYKYIESSVDLTGIGERPLDGQVIALLTGTILQKYRKLEYIIVSAPKDEYERLGGIINAQFDNFSKITRLTRTSLLNKPNKKLEPIYMLKDTYKRDYIKQMPKELLNIAWSCRTPKNGQACGECHTCQQLT